MIALRLLLVSFLLLFLELALIRYLPSEVRVLSFFTNLVLLASFLGLGVGSLLARRRWRLLPFCPLLLALVLYVARVFSSVLVVQRGEIHHHLWTIYLDLSPAARKVGITETLLLFFVLVALTFVPLGQELGRLFRRLRPLKAYSLDILGSIAGSLLLTILAANSLPPILWFGVAGLGLLIAVFGESPGKLRASLAILGIMLSTILVGMASEDELWTPYYRISQVPFPGGFDLTVNASLHQTALDLSPEATSISPEVALIASEYAVPYRMYRETHHREPSNVLVLGAGTGNDVAVALEHNVSRVVAVEIDPVIAQMGRDLHPNRPYADPRVELHVADARSFLRKSSERFDLIVFGTLDSQTLLSGMSTIRLDNYVYTVESLAEAREHLADDGVLALFFMVTRDWIHHRLYRMVEITDGMPPIDYRPEKSGQIRVSPIFNLLLLAGPGTHGVPRPESPALFEDTVVASDNWPYLYLREPGIPPPYRSVLPMLLIISFGAVLPLFPRRHGAVSRARGMGFYFCMGVGFMLVETKGITELSLLFGSTWTVSAVVITSVLSTILMANLVSFRFDLRRHKLLFPFLGICLLANWLVPPSVFLALPRVFMIPAAGLFFAMPVFAAGLLFARRFRGEEDPDRALGWNLIGAMVGGIVEYLSMAFGIRILYLVAMVFYSEAWLCDRQEPWPEEAASSTSDPILSPPG